MAMLFKLRSSGLQIGEMFIAKYEFGHQSSLGLHRDSHPFSFIICLNEPDNDFEGGGTRFHDEVEEGGATKEKRPKEPGTAVAFCGFRLHEGLPVSRGTRYILTGFCKYDSEIP